MASGDEVRERRQGNRNKDTVSDENRINQPGEGTNTNGMYDSPNSQHNTTPGNKPNHSQMCSNQLNSDMSNFGMTAQPTYSSTTEYCNAVRQWLWQNQAWQQINMLQATIPFYAMSCFAMQQQMSASGGSLPPFGGMGVFPTQSQRPNQSQGQGQPQQPVTIPAGDNRNMQQPQPARPANQPGRPTHPQREGREYKIPSLWKRVFAEFIDFVLLFLLKLGVTIMAVEYVGIVDIQKYDLEYLLNQNLDYNAAFAITSELVAMEVINRIFICIFETLCLRRGVAGFIGGTTPGKRLLGLCVVSCEDATMLAGNHIRVTPAGDIGFWNALVRSVIKNFSLAFFFPVCFTVFFFQYNRAAYDIISNCIVVERLEEQFARRR